MYQFTEEDYENKYGYPLSSKMESEAIASFINAVATLINQSIKVHEEDLTTYQQGKLIEAQLWQAQFMIDNGFLPGMSGYDPFTNTMVDMNQLEKRYIGPMARLTLTYAGLTYRGVR